MAAPTTATPFTRGGSPALYGGEEFVILLPGTTLEGAAAFYERAAKTCSNVLAKRDRVFPARERGAVGSGSGKSAGEILAAADRAMYEAERRGKDGIFIPE